MAQVLANQTVKRFSVGVGVLACLALSGCGGGGGGGGGSNPPPPAPDPAPNPSIDVEATAIDFGAVVINQQVQRRLQVTNTGNVNLDVTAGINDIVFGVNGDCTGVAPGESCNFLVTFRPNMQQDFGVDLDLDSEAGTSTIALSGEGLGLNVQIVQLDTTCPAGEVNGRATVTDSTTKPVTGLDASAFTLFLNGDPANGVTLLTFDPITELDPVTVGVVVDISQSLAGFRNDAAQQASIFLDTFFSDDDTAGIFRFASEVDTGDIARGFITTDDAGKAELEDTFNQPFSGTTDNTVIWDSADTVLDLITDETATPPLNPQRAIVLISDGQDTVSDTTLDELIARAVEENIAFFSIGFGEIDSLPLERLANETGGLFFVAPDSTELNATFTAIAENLTNQYDFTFDHPAPQSDAELTVEVLDDPNRGEDSRSVPSCP